MFLLLTLPPGTAQSPPFFGDQIQNTHASPVAGSACIRCTITDRATSVARGFSNLTANAGLVRAIHCASGAIHLADEVVMCDLEVVVICDCVIGNVCGSYYIPSRDDVLLPSCLSEVYREMASCESHVIVRVMLAMKWFEYSLPTLHFSQSMCLHAPRSQFKHRRGYRVEWKHAYSLAMAEAKSLQTEESCVRCCTDGLEHKYLPVATRPK